MTHKNFSEDHSSTYLDAHDEEIFQKYAAREFDEHIFDSINHEVIIRTSIVSTRAYMHESKNFKNRFGEPFRIYPGIINTIQPHAFAARSNGLHLCGMNAGLSRACFELSIFIMAQSSMFQDIGYPEKEISLSIPLEISPASFFINKIFEKSRNNTGGFFHQLLPKCAVRYDFSTSLTLLMLRFIWFHEYFHCLNGHVVSLSGKNSTVRLNEFSDHDKHENLLPPDASDCLLSKAEYFHALEFDADRAALLKMFQIQMENKENITGIRNKPRKLQLKMILFVTFIITSVFVEFRNAKNQSPVQYDPENHKRLTDVMESIGAYLIDPYPDNNPIMMSFLTELKQLKLVIPNAVDIFQLSSNCNNSKVRLLRDQRHKELEIAQKYFSKYKFQEI